MNPTRTPGREQDSRTHAVDEVDPAEALARQRNGALMIDVREDSERAVGMPLDAVGLARGLIEEHMADLAPDRQREILTLCGSGRRSMLAAATLRELGYARVASVRGGFAAWK
ncbi:MAG: rhodanese-like domain-containing protein, partial [Rhodanobacteraceae bacterium]